ncbi:MAG: hypothetical protein KME11_20310 [Timaviella obliquedivisa GSE-PSE-MK23-08B]|jgi:hypothetical protein|nr:hypothetical protein [Timaviella obliquedivisa GSE-PSE-MK23-08B]
MALNPSVMQAVERLGYRVTVGDVASQAGLEVQVAERDLLELASEAGGHMQVAESGEMAYLFSNNFRDVLRNKYFRLRLQEWWSKIWGVLFYIIRVSFGIVLIASILLIMLAIAIILIALASSRGDNDNDSGGSWGGGSGGGMGFFSPDFFWIFTPNYYDDRAHRRKSSRDGNEMNFLESVFSFLFGDGDPNADLNDRRWKTIATVIRNNNGAIVAEQVVPYLDNLGDRSQQEFEDYMLPVLTRFNGRPEVSPTGQIIYHFPQLQVSAQQQQSRSVGAYLKESLWRFSQAGSGQIILAAGLGGVNLVGALVLGSLLRDGTIAAQLGGLVAFVGGIYGILLAYGIGFLGIPLARYFWIQWRNRGIESRNVLRQERAIALNSGSDTLNQKLSFAKQFAAATVVDAKDLAYTTESDLTEQEFLNADKVDAEWRKRLEQS